ncbi:Gfo/Idh/MocA family oxidoreductase [Mesorhizobium sp. B2-4-15]|uniref:Gfo/Idh/MocA family protein n=1 Tax=Mesorhizobium sp. B2-4-15 TaxID=2589934 RepID=UPI001151B4FE|nr:Gfo/Idh/MocA family oxidoreductase [Mesorhizobium sp. B2-4-15]TPK73606.1 Gfo/Idh/MocA family oxidoreductase [Mesorhizobium sp. B2-4-15]
MKKAEMNVALIGSGLIGGRHIEAVQKTDGLRMAVICDVVAEKAEAAAAKYGVAQTSSNPDAVLADPSIDVVIVAVPNRFHQDVAVAAAQAGKHMLLEKPVAHNMESALKIKDACAKAGTVVRVGHNERCWDASILARKIVQAGVLGDVFTFRNVFSHSWDVVSIDDYRWNLEISGGASMMDITIHSVDLVRYLIGGQYNSVASSLRHVFMPKAVDDNVNLVAEMSNGASGTFTSDRFSPLLHFTTELYGTKGSLHLSQSTVGGATTGPLTVFSSIEAPDLPEEMRDYLRPRTKGIHSTQKPDGWHHLYPPHRNPYLNQMRAFSRVLHGEEPGIALCTLDDGIHNLEVMHAAYTGMNERRWVDVPQPAGTPWVIPHYD